MPTRQDSVENRDKVYFFSTGRIDSLCLCSRILMSFILTNAFYCKKIEVKVTKRLWFMKYLCPFLRLMSVGEIAIWSSLD